jgi:hypothetical protein
VRPDPTAGPRAKTSQPSRIEMLTRRPDLTSSSTLSTSRTIYLSPPPLATQKLLPSGSS